MDNGTLKPGWTWVTFGDMVRQVKDKVDAKQSGLKRYVGGEHMDTDDLRIRRWGEINEDYLGPAFHMRFQPGQVLYGSRRTYLRKVAVPDFEGICANTTFVLESANAELLLPELLPFVMQTEAFHEHSIAQSKGSVNPYVNFSDLAWYEFALPPLEEQRRIAEVLKACQHVVESEYELEAQANGLIRSLSKQHFMNEPKGSRCRIREIAEVRNGTTPSRKKEAYWDGAIPWLPTGKVNERIISQADEYITEKALDECSLQLIPPDSILIAMIGQGTTRGKAAFLNFQATINQNFAAIIPSKKIHPWFLFYQMEHNYELLRAWSQGSNQLALNCGLIGHFPIFLPDLETQEKMVFQFLKIEEARSVAAVRFRHAKDFFLTALREFLEPNVQRSQHHRSVSV